MGLLHEHRCVFRPERGQKTPERLTSWVIERCVYDHVRHRCVGDKGEELFGERGVQVVAYGLHAPGGRSPDPWGIGPHAFKVLDGLRVQVAAGRQCVKEVFGNLECAEVRLGVRADVVPAKGFAPRGVPVDADVAAADKECATGGVGK
jgi:hypothetical protein